MRKMETKRNLAGKESLEEMTLMRVAARQVKRRIAKRRNIPKQQGQALIQVKMKLTVIMNKTQEVSLGDSTCQDSIQVGKNSLQDLCKDKFLAMMIVIILPLTLPLMKKQR